MNGFELCLSILKGVVMMVILHIPSKPIGNRTSKKAKELKLHDLSLPLTLDKLPDDCERRFKEEKKLTLE